MIRFQEIEGYPNEKTLAEIREVYGAIFEKIDVAKFEKRLKEAVNLHIILAIRENVIVGFKIGYQIDSTKFYSWIGGVDVNFRKNGIAAELMHANIYGVPKKDFAQFKPKQEIPLSRCLFSISRVALILSRFIGISRMNSRLFWKNS